MTNESITAVILAGGKSSRMGDEKPFLKINGITFIESIYKTLKTIFNDVIISSDGPERFISMSCEVIPDIYTDCGPLSGIYSCMRNIKTEYVFLTSCDMPLLNTQLVSHIVKNSINGAVNIGQKHNDKYPLLGIYPTNISEQLKLFLNQKKRRVFDFLDNLKEGYNIIELSEFNAVLLNINTPDEYEKMLETVKITKITL
jgi:molybdenum cofactor guanylyltransferase